MQPEDPNAQQPSQKSAQPQPQPGQPGYGAIQQPVEQAPNPELPNSPAYQSPEPQPAPPAEPQPQTPPVDNTVDGKPVNNPLESMQPGERVICEIKRHPIGILGIYFSFVAAILLVAIVGYGFAPQIFTNMDSSRAYGYVTLALLVVAVLGGLFGYIAHIVYWGNRWIVTDDSVTQIMQNSLFNKQSSQLSMGNLEDISAEKNGILPHLFNYGVLKAETAGAKKNNFHFLYCPNPDYYAKCILDAREKFELQHYRNPQSQPYIDASPQQPTSPTGQPPQVPQS
jgi:hypothetical protein